MTDMWKIVTVTVASEDGCASASANTDTNAGDVDATIEDVRESAIDAYTSEVGSLDHTPHRIFAQVVEFPEPKLRHTVVTATLGEEAAEAPVSFTAA